MSKALPRALSILLVLIWGSSYLSIKVVVSELHPVTAALYRFVLTAILMIAMRLLLVREPVAWPDRLLMMMGGLSGITFYTMLENTAVQWTTPGNVSVLLAIVPVITLIVQHFLYHQPIAKIQAVGTLFSFGGVAWIMAAKGDVSLFSKGLWGDLMAIGAALCWVAYTLLNRNFSRSYQSLTVMAEEMVWGAVFLIPFSFALPLVRPSALVLANLAFLAVVCSAVGYFIYLFCLRRLGALEMTNYINLMPLVALGLSAWLLAEPFGTAQLAGSGLILFGVSLVTLGPNLMRRKEA